MLYEFQNGWPGAKMGAREPRFRFRRQGRVVLGERSRSDESGQAPIASAVTFTIVSSAAEFEALAADWRALFAAASRPFSTQSYDWCRARFEESGSHGKLFCVVGRRGEKIVLIWPFLVSRRMGVRVARGLGHRTTEFDDVLVADTPDAEAVARAAWAFALAHCPADLFSLSAVPDESMLARVLRDEPGLVQLARAVRKYVSWDDLPTWDDYLRTMKKDRRKSNDRRMRRLSEVGPITFERVTEPGAVRTTLDWLLARKVEWRRQTKLRNVWRRVEDWRAFMMRTACDPEMQRHTALFQLKCGDTLIAAEFARFDAARVEGVINAYHSEYAQYSPSELLTLHTLQWAQARRLDYDFRIGDEAYKDAWANRRNSVAYYWAPRTLLGRQLIHARRAAQGARETVRKVRGAVRRPAREHETATS